MKTIFQIFLYIFFYPISGHCQLLIDYTIESEIKEIVDNFLENEVENFDILFQERFNSKRVRKDKFKYQFIDEFQLFHTYKRHSATYELQDEHYVRILDHKDSIWIENRQSAYFQSTIDSSGMKTILNYYLIEGDTLLSSTYTVKEDAGVKTEISKYLSDSTWNGQKIITTSLSDSSERIQSFTLKNNKWFKFYDYIETHGKIASAKIKVNTVTNVGSQFGGGFKNSDEFIAKTDFGRTSQIFFDNDGIIEKVLITTIDSVGNRNVITLIPRIKNYF